MRLFLVVEFEVEEELGDCVVFLGFALVRGGVGVCLCRWLPRPQRPWVLAWAWPASPASSSAKGMPSTSGSGSPSSNSISNSSCSAPARRRWPRGRRYRRPWAWKSGWQVPRAGLAELRHPQGDRPHGQLVAGLQDLLSGDFLAVDKRPVGAAEVTDRELVRDLEDFAVPPADLRRLDADQAVIVAADAGDAIGQLESRRGTSAADDLKYVVHRGFVPIAWHVGSHMLPTK